MPAAVALTVGIGALAQVLLGRWIDWPWVIPDLMLLSLVVAAAQCPRRSLAPAAVAGYLAMTFTVPVSLSTGLAYVGAGWAVASLADRWDLTRRSMQVATIAVVEGLLVAVQGWGSSSNASFIGLDSNPFGLSNQAEFHRGAAFVWFGVLKVVSTVCGLPLWSHLTWWCWRRSRARPDFSP